MCPMRFTTLMCAVLVACTGTHVPHGDDGGADCGPGEARDGVGACADVNACRTHPCAERAICADLPAPAADDELGRTCACAPGHDGDGYSHCSVFAHPGLLHTDEDFERMRTRVAAREEPWLSGWNRLVDRGRITTGYEARPVAVIRRPGSEYSVAIIDAEWAYARALAWKITGDRIYADAAIAILDAWSERVVSIEGNADRFLAAGILGHMFANVGEIMRDYD